MSGGHHDHQIVFELDPEKYKFGVVLGSGSHGVVVSAFVKSENRTVAVKQVPRLLDNLRITKRILREIRLLQSLKGHTNIMELLDVVLIRDSLYIITEACQIDLKKLLHQVGKRNKYIARSDCLSIMFQILSGIEFFHASDIIHRDIKPANILLDSDFNVKICDFGLARVIKKNSPDDMGIAEAQDMTEYVVTRWYRAPEIVISPGRYGKSQDIWSAATTFAEVFTFSPLFPGASVIDQLHVIVDVLGKPAKKDLDFNISDRSRRYLEEMTSKETGLRSALAVILSAHPDVFALLEDMLAFNPYHRITAQAARSYPLFANMLLASDEHDKVLQETDLKPPQGLDLRFIDECEETEEAFENLVRSQVYAIQMARSHKTAKKRKDKRQTSQRRMDAIPSPDTTAHRDITSGIADVTPPSIATAVSSSSGKYKSDGVTSDPPVPSSATSGRPPKVEKIDIPKPKSKAKTEFAAGTSADTIDYEVVPTPRGSVKYFVNVLSSPKGSSALRKSRTQVSSFVAKGFTALAAKYGYNSDSSGQSSPKDSSKAGSPPKPKHKEMRHGSAETVTSSERASTKRSEEGVLFHVSTRRLSDMTAHPLNAVQAQSSGPGRKAVRRSSHDHIVPMSLNLAQQIAHGDEVGEMRNTPRTGNLKPLRRHSHTSANLMRDQMLAAQLSVPLTATSATDTLETTGTPRHNLRPIRRHSHTVAESDHRLTRYEDISMRVSDRPVTPRDTMQPFRGGKFPSPSVLGREFTVPEPLHEQDEACASPQDAILGGGGGGTPPRMRVSTSADLLVSTHWRQAPSPEPFSVPISSKGSESMSRPPSHRRDSPDNILSQVSVTTPAEAGQAGKWYNLGSDGMIRKNLLPALDAIISKPLKSPFRSRKNPYKMNDGDDF